MAPFHFHSIPPGGLLTILASLILPETQPASVGSQRSLSAAQDSSVRHLGVGPVVGACLLAGWLAVLLGTTIASNATAYAGTEFLHWFQVTRIRVVTRA